MNKNEFKVRALSLLFPRRCPFCRKTISAEENFCAACARQLPTAVYTRFAVGGVPCCAPLLYTENYAKAVRRMKFGKKKYYAHALALLMARAVSRIYQKEAFDLITFVPADKKSLRQRGFNQAEELAKELAVYINLPYISVLEKYKRNVPQHTLKRSERLKNVRGVFRVPKNYSLKNKNILLVDDIITTGNTLGECARMLKRAGCQSVSCAVVCTTNV